MKIIKTLKYKLTEGNIEKDIEKFILEARRGKFAWDYKYGNEGLKIIKAYFKMIQEKFDNNEFEECQKCYSKLILFLFDASRGDDKASFGYEDLLAKVSKDFDKLIKNYFICLIKVCDIENLAEKIAEYASKLKEYGFDSDKEILFQNLSKEQLKILEEKMLEKTVGMTKKDDGKHEIIYFLMSLTGVKKDKEKYILLCERFKGILDDKTFNYLKKEYEENE